MSAHHATPVLQKALVQWVARVLRPLARLLLRHGMSCLEFEEISRWVFVDVVLREEEFALSGRNRRFKSRAAILTGLSRKEVMRLAQQAAPEERADMPCRNRAARVVAAWLAPPFTDANGAPRVLAIRDGSLSFGELVRRHSGDVPHRAILDELLQSGVAETLDAGHVRLKLPRPLYPQLSRAELAQASETLADHIRKS